MGGLCKNGYESVVSNVDCLIGTSLPTVKHTRDLLITVFVIFQLFLSIKEQLNTYVWSTYRHTVVQFHTAALMIGKVIQFQTHAQK